MSDRPSLLKEIIPPLCLVLSLMAFIAAFASMAVERPQPSVELHRARISGDEEYRDLLEEQLRQQRLRKIVLTGGLFAGAIMLGAAGYLAMPRH